MKRVLIISLNSGGTMGHGKIITSLSNFLSQKGKQVIILSDKVDGICCLWSK